MEHYDDTNTTPPASNGAGSNASSPPIPPDQSSSGDSSTHCSTASAQPWPNTAIERQIARDNYRKQTYRLTPNRPTQPRKHSVKAKRRMFHPAVLASGIIVLLLVAAGIVFIVNDRDHLVQNAVSQFLQSNFFQDVKQMEPSPNPSPLNSLPTVDQSAIAAAPNPTAISLPIADISLRSRPEFLAQLVQVYRSQLANNPNDSQARSALAQLQERSLAELQTIIAEGDEAAVADSMESAVKIFPELRNNTRYMYLVTRMDYIQRQPRGESAKADVSNTSTAAAPTTTATTAPATTAPLPAPTVPATPSAAATPPAEVVGASTPQRSLPATATPIAAAPVTAPASAPMTTTPAKTSSPTNGVASISNSTATVKRTSAIAASLKPEIRSVSITPGTMAQGEFTPSDEGNVFLVEIGYRNFDKAFGDKTEATLVTRLGVPGDSMVLAEVPVVITADRGTTSFIAETYVQSSPGGKFQLNFILNDEFLTSRTLRISMPKRAAVEN